MHRPTRWTRDAVEALFTKPFNDLLFEAQQVHRDNFPANEVQVSTLLSVKTGACPEDCHYCPQSARYQTEVEPEKLLEVEQVLAKARAAKAAGASRFCMGAAWRNPKDRDLPALEAMVRGVRDLGLESCMTLGMLAPEQANRLAAAGLDYYNHNLDTSPDYYGEIISTRNYQARLDTLDHVREAGMKVCSGGILGLGEERHDRAGLLLALAQLPVPPESIPINQLVPVPGTPLGDEPPELDNFEFIRVIAITRIMFPSSHVRLSAGREQMSDEMQALCFLAGANSVFYGEKLLTTANPIASEDEQLFERLGLIPAPAQPKQPLYYDATA